MKSIILTAQEARELEMLGGLTVAKPIKPEPLYIEGAFMEKATDCEKWQVVDETGRHVGKEDGAEDCFVPPVQTGDIIFIREPWTRLKNQDGEPTDRVRLAAESTVAEGQESYKWSSPVSMPESAARRFAVVRKVEPVYNENVAVWSITLEALTKAAAEAGEAGALPYSNATEPKEGHDYFTYAGDISPEDHDSMVAAINADRARIAEESDPPGEETAAGAGEDAKQDPTEDEEVGSFTLGKCNYCGWEWGVTLEGAKGGGYPTQRTANAAATRVCDCPEAVENRRPEIGVAFAVTTGACRYCNQIQEVGPHPSQAAADETATEVCSCPSARAARRIAEQIEDAKDRVNRLFGERAETLGFKPVAGDGAINLLEKVVELIAKGPISSASINIRGQCKAKFSITSKGKIKVSRSETRSCDLEAGE